MRVNTISPGEAVRYEILGPEHEQIEEKFYGHGVTMAQKRAAVETLKYPTR